MQFGIHLPIFGPYGDALRLADLAAEAEEAGWDGFFLWDAVANAFPLPLVDPWIALTAIALNTKRIRLGLLVTPLSRRRPWKVARETVSLELSNLQKAGRQRLAGQSRSSAPGRAGGQLRNRSHPGSRRQ